MTTTITVTTMVTILVAIMAREEAGAAAAETFKVGGSSGWALSAGYQTWSDSNTYHVGDTLDFVYDASSHSVAETDEAGFKGCSSANAVSQDSTGNTKIKLTTPGMHYFICPTPGHCASGMKLSVNVLKAKDSSPAAAATPTTPSSSSATGTGTSTGSGGSSPAHTSAAVTASSTALVAVSFAMAVVIAALLMALI